MIYFTLLPSFLHVRLISTLLTDWVVFPVFATTATLQLESNFAATYSRVTQTNIQSLIARTKLHSWGEFVR